MWRDDEIKINIDSLPDKLAELVREADAEYEKGKDNWFDYGMAVENMLIIAKGCYLSALISLKTWHDLACKYIIDDDGE